MTAGRNVWLSALLLVFAAEAVAADSATPAAVAKILSTQCLRCHHDPKPQGGLNLSTRENMLHGGDRGPAIKIGDPDASLLIQRVTEGSMPPISDGDQLSTAEVEKLRRWVQSGADWPAGLTLTPPSHFVDERQDKRFGNGRSSSHTLARSETETGLQEDWSCLNPSLCLTKRRVVRWRRCGGSRPAGIHRRPRIKSS